MQPNLILITPDQLRADYLGCYGNARVRTPNIDALATDGVQFDKCYCASPLCAPSRISFATSTYVGEHNHRQYWGEISPDVPNIVTSLKRAGYRTGMFGKNHLFEYARLPELWDELNEVCLGNYDGHPDYCHSFSSFTLADDHPFNITGKLTGQLADFIDRSDAPFFGWVNYQDPHPAFCCPEPYASMFDPSSVMLPATFDRRGEDGRPVRNRVWSAHSEMDKCTEDDMRRAIAHYMGQVAYVDDCVGRIVAALRRKGTLDNTVVLFFSDHGELLGDYRMTHKNPTFYDCLTRIPAILKAPGLGRGQRFRGLVEEVDLAPTLLSLLGTAIPPTMVGRNLAEALRTGDDAGRDSVLVEAGGGAPTVTQPVAGMTLLAPFAPTSFGPGAMVRRGDWKLSVYADDVGELYNVADDPHEMNNLYDNPAHAAIRTEMTELLLKRVLGVKVRDVGLEWQYPPYPTDVRFYPLEYGAGK